ncbi:MAG: hypothetical protein ACRYG4_29050 [Janthinobacterium lividum]
MNPFEMVVLIILIVTIGRVASARYGVGRGSRRSRRDRDFVDAPNAVSIEDGTRMKSEIDRLNERIRVLERLATDPSKRLSDQIDALGTPNRDR